MPFYEPTTILVLDKKENQAPDPHRAPNLIGETAGVWAIGIHGILG